MNGHCANTGITLHFFDLVISFLQKYNLYGDPYIDIDDSCNHATQSLADQVQRQRPFKIYNHTSKYVYMLTQHNTQGCTVSFVLSGEPI